MPDEFPTLEVVLVASVAVLAWRGFLLRAVHREIETALPRLLATVADRTAPASGTTPPRFGAALDPLARAALAKGTEAPGRSVAERALHEVRRVKSAAARDLVICAVLVGALAYAFATGLAVTRVFFLLGAVAAFLLLLAVRDRLALARSVAAAGTKLAHALGARSSEPPAQGAGRCSRCGEPRRESLRPDELGARLIELGARELYVCPRCGRIEGRAERREPSPSAPEEKAW